MASGPGKYDDLCTHVRTSAKADAAIVIVLGGEKGAGFSLQTSKQMNLAHIANVLEDVAKQIRAAADDGMTP
jgi:hypothetical protein